MSNANFNTDDAVNVFSIDDERMKVLAKVISNKSSIEILNSLFYHEMTVVTKKESPYIKIRPNP